MRHGVSQYWIIDLRKENARYPKVILLEWVGIIIDLNNYKPIFWLYFIIFFLWLKHIYAIFFYNLICNPYPK